ncbi:MAG: cytochrome C [Ignavibacteriota bacterium]
MKKFFRIVGYFLAGIVLLIIAGFIYFNSKYPDLSKPKDIKVEITPERLQRGKYLANHVAGCMDCHSLRDWTKLAGPPKSGTEGEGGEKFGKELGVPGTLYAKNITPAAIGNWTDGELIRAITQGVNKDNKALFPLMPYPELNHLSKEDLYSIVAYIRLLKPIENNVLNTELDFPLNFLVKTMPLKEYSPAPEPNKNDPVNYGKYLTTLAGCTHCHTPSEKGEPKPGMDFAGGQEYILPQGTARSENITPDEETGIGRWTKDEFIERFKSFDSDSAKNIPVGPHEFNTIMPFTSYAGMTEEDLGAIYDYLRTIKPVHNPVIIFTPAKN